jgi:hypothetical protein
MGEHPMKKFSFAALAMLVMVLAGCFPAPASAMPVMVQKALPSDSAPLLLTEVRSRHYNRHHNRHYNRHHHRHRHYGWGRNNWRYPGYGYWRPRYYGPCYDWDGFGCEPGFGYYGGPWLGYGPAIVLRDRGYGYGRRHVKWCLNRYRSYNPRNNTWVAYSGRVRQCISPYGP